jgi:polygalacturonase
MADSSIISVLDFGVTPHSSQVQTSALQRAIDASAQRGATLVIPAGTFLTGTLRLPSNLTLQIEAGGVLQGSPTIADYPPARYYEHPWNHKDNQPHNLLVAVGAENICIRGQGRIDGSGPAFWGEKNSSRFYTEKDQRPSPMLEFYQCRRVRLDGITISNSPGWTVHVHACSEMHLHGIQVRNDLFGPNTDGFDITDSRDILISDCDLICGDDAIVLKSFGGTNERISVTNCILWTNCSALKLGANESLGTIRQVTMSNCIVRNSSRGVSLYNMGGGTFEDISFSNLILECVNDIPLVCPIHINASRNPSPERTRGIGSIRNVRISDVLCKSDARILLTAQDGGMLENIFLDNILMEYPSVENEFAWAARAECLQFSPGCPAPRAAQACVVASNIRGFQARDIATTWPAAPQAAMHFLWARNIRGGIVDCPLGRASRPDVPRLDVAHCEDLAIRCQ